MAIFRRFPNFQNWSKGQTNVCEHFPTISGYFPNITEDWVQMNVVPRSTGNTNSGARELTLKCNRRLPKTTEDPKIDHIPTNLSVFNGTRSFFKNDILTCEDIISLHGKIQYGF